MPMCSDCGVSGICHGNGLGCRPEKRWPAKVWLVWSGSDVSLFYTSEAMHKAFPWTKKGDRCRHLDGTTEIAQEVCRPPS